MPLNDFEELGFRMCNLFHFYLWPLPAKWNSDYSQLIETKPAYKCLPFALITIFELILTLANIFLTIYYWFWYPTPAFGQVHGVILLTIGGCSGAMAVIILHAHFGDYLTCIVNFVNHVLTNSEDMIKEFPDTNKLKRTGTSSSFISILFPLLVVPVGAAAPFVAFICSMLIAVDPIYYILEMILPDPMYREYSVIIVALIFRACCVFLATLDFCRVAVFLFGGLLIIMDRLQTAEIICISRIKSFNRFLFYYNNFAISFKSIELWFNIVIYTVLSGIFWATVVCSWGSVTQSPTQITMPVYASFVVACISLVAVHVFLLPMICEIIEMVLYTIKVQKLRTKVLYCKNRTKTNKICMMQSLAVVPLRVWYGKFWFMGHDFVPEYLWMLQLRCFDAILVFG